MTYFCL